MKKWKFLFVIILATSFSSLSQEISFPKWGQFSEYERELKVYEKDTTANAIVLNEVGYAYIKKGGAYEIVKKQYYRIKILNIEGFKYATIKIPTYKDEKIKEIKASTTSFLNGTKTTYLDKTNIYRTKDSEDWYITSFTLPIVQVGSIIEYSFNKHTTYRFTFADGWVFQSEIPKIKSTYHTTIPAFWNYHITTISIDNSKILEQKLINDCFDVNGAVAQCVYSKFELDNIPAFTEEDYSTSKNNFLKQVRFELKTFKQTDGTVKQYTRSWKDTDDVIFKKYQIGKDYKKTKFISKHIPSEILDEPNELEKAKKIYTFIKLYMNYNGKQGNKYSFNSKEAFQQKTGNLYEINTNLVNALLASGIKADFGLLSTRNNGFPTKLHPVITDFNYMVAHIIVDDKHYFLDATDKNLSFGELPFYCLNDEIRVFDKRNGSYWYKHKPDENNETIIHAIANVIGQSEIEIQTRVIYKGYNATNKREEISELSEEEYINKLNDENEELQITKQTIENVDDTEKPIIETIEFKSESDFVNNSIYLKPFVIKSFKTNPFKLEERNYPVDIGYKRKFTYNLIFNIPANYKIKSLPENRKIVLPNMGGTLAYLSDVKNNKITINFSFSLDRTIYKPNEYYLIKEFISQLIIAQNERIILTKE